MSQRVILCVPCFRIMLRTTPHDEFYFTNLSARLCESCRVALLAAVREAQLTGEYYINPPWRDA